MSEKHRASYDINGTFPKKKSFWRIGQCKNNHKNSISSADGGHLQPNPACRGKKTPPRTSPPGRRATNLILLLPSPPRIPPKKSPARTLSYLRLDDDDLVLEGGDLAGDGHVNEAGAVLAVGDNEAAEEGGVDLGLELDVLGAGHLLDLLGDHELLLVLELHGGSHGGDLQ